MARKKPSTPEPAADAESSAPTSEDDASSADDSPAEDDEEGGSEDESDDDEDARAKSRRRRRARARRRRKRRGDERSAAPSEKKRRRRRRPAAAEEPEAVPVPEDDELDELDEDEEYDGPPPFPAKRWSAADRREWRLGLIVATVLIVVFYGATVCHWIGLGDTALLIDEITRFNINSHVNNHTTAIFFGHLFSKLPFGELAFRVNLMSVVAGSASMVLMYLIAYRTLRSLIPALLATASIAVMHSMWWHSTMVENYAFNAVALLSVLLLLLKDEERTDSTYYYYACGVAGLAVVNHVQMGSLSVVVFIYAILQRRKDNYGLVTRWVKMALAFLLGFLPYLLVFLRDVSNSGNFVKTLYWATGGDFQSRMFDFQLAKASRGLVMEFVLQYPTPMLAFMVLGVDYLFEKKWYPKAHIAIAAAFLINTFFFMQFHTWDKFAFLLPSFLIVGYWGVIGIKSVLEKVADKNPWWRRGAFAAMAFCVVFPPFFYHSLPVWAEDKGFWHGRFNNNFTRNSHNCASYIANPNKAGWNDMAEFAELLLSKLPERSVFLDDDGRTYYPLHHYYQQHYKRRPDISFLLLNSWGFENWGTTEDSFVRLARANIGRRPLFLVSLQHPHGAVVNKLGEHGIAPRRYQLDEEHWIYELVKIDSRKDDQGNERLIVTDINVGAHFNTRVPVLKSRFDDDESISVKIDFLPNKSEIEVLFRWYTPDGSTYFESEPFTIPAENTSVWSHLDRTGDRPPGAWRIEAVVAGEVLAEVALTIE
ncbi:MAG: DUF2723 domain-containing protein [Deltaproteobacteria bacterium]|jgi:hypothetical protein|nr:DUF2723 domain-containing protein [Deltaproteobacteria bacterium]MBW2530774.1 DUF2723 domain-containing protein [Deltaproteobacteria bacterium]